jgi:hypothetical protein
MGRTFRNPALLQHWMDNFHFGLILQAFHLLSRLPAEMTEAKKQGPSARAWIPPLDATRMSGCDPD